ncbi:MAG: DMT family transporter [Terricaulis sp.]
MRASRFPPALVLLTAIAFGAGMDATIKYLCHTNNVALVTTGRYFFGAAFSLIPWLHAGRPPITREIFLAHLPRGLVVSMSGVAFFWGLTVLPLAEAVTISFIYPLLVPFIAAAMIGEHVRPTGIIAALIGFAGVLVAMIGAPSMAASPMHAYGVGAVLFSALTFCVAMVLLRDRAKKDGPVIVGLLSSLMPGLFLGPPAILLSAPPHWEQWWAFLLLGALAAVFMYLLSRAYAHAETQQLAPIHYTELLWATFMGFFIFHETPRISIFFGAALIIAACLYSTYGDRRIAIKPEPAA